MSAVRSVFDSTGSYLASCILAIDSYKIRIQPVDLSSTSTNSTTTFSLEKNLKVMSLQWGVFNNVTITTDTTKLQDQYLAICLNNGTILIYSPVQNEIISTLINPTHQQQAVLDFHHSKYTRTAFTVDISGHISEWDLTNYKHLRTFTLADTITSATTNSTDTNTNEPLNKVTTIMHQNKIHLLVASYNIFLIELSNLKLHHTFPGHVTDIHTLQTINSNSTDNLFITCANNDRFINIYSVTKQNIEKVLVSQSNVLDVSANDKIVVAITEDDVEVFNDPIAAAAISSSNSNATTNGNNIASFKKKKSQSKSKNSDTRIQIKRPENKNPTNESLKINGITISNDHLILTWLEHPNIPFFDSSITWFDSVSKTFKLTQENDIVLYKEKPTIIVNDHSLHGHDVASSKQYNEGNTIIQTGDSFKDLDGENEDEEEESLADKVAKFADIPLSSASNGSGKDKAKGKNKKASIGTLTSILTQAIRSNDHTLLESVLNNKDENVIKNTIKRLNTTYIIPLLNRISERIARNSSKQSVLNVWIKWLFIIHGGFLNNYPNLTKNLGILHTTLHRRAVTLGRLLELNGKIDMILENMELKKLIIKSGNTTLENDDNNDNESDVEYIEELEDNGLEIDEDEEDSFESGSDIELGSESESESESEGTTPVNDIDMDIDDDQDDEDNYSDEEVGVKKINADIE